jgi:N-acetylglucosamine transport system substrate-binding protein
MLRRRSSFGALFLVALMAGCGSPGGGSDDSAPAPKLTVAKKAAPASIEVVAFKGGYNIDFYQSAGKAFEAAEPGMKVAVTGDSKIWEKLKPRFISGDVPDLVFPGWGMDHWGLVEEGQLFDLTEAMNSPAFDGKTAWKDTFDEKLLKLGQLDGKQYVLPYYVMVYGWWYNPDLFAANGWTAPKTYSELLSLCEKIKAKGIAPLTFQGKYPYYMLDGFLLPWCYSVGGGDAVKAAQNLEPGAWKSPAMLKAASMIRELADKGYFQTGATGLNHTESQMEFLRGKAAMIPCGSWLQAEMKDVMPKGAKLAFFLPPVADGGKGDASSLLIGIEPWMVPAKAKHPEAGIEFFKFMTSLEQAKAFVKEKGTLMAIKGSDEVEMDPTLKGAADAFKASKEVWAVQYRQWYPAFNKKLEDAMAALLNREITPEAFCDRAEAAAEECRKDSAIPKHKL